VFAATTGARFAQMVACYGEQTALVDGERRWSFGELAAVGEQIAAAVAHAGRQQRDDSTPIVISDHFSMELIASLVACWLLGRPYTVLDPEWPLARRTEMVAYLGATLILTSSRCAADWVSLAGAEGATPMLLVTDQLPERGALPALAASAKPSSPDDPVCICFTSGSSGKPKGVVQSHRSFLQRDLSDFYPFGPGDRLACLYYPAFGGAIADLVNGVLRGAATYLYDVKRRGLHELAGWLRTHQITVLHMSGPLLSEWLSQLLPDDKFPALRLVRPSQRLRTVTVRQLRAHLPERCRFLHGMAATETGIVTCHAFDGHILPDADTLSVGAPVRGITLWLLDEQGRAVETGASGELWVESRSLALGYWNDPAATGERFFPSPHDPAARRYRTGDRARLLASGELELVGRADLQVKIRGYRVELGEVERALAAVAGAADPAHVVVVARSSLPDTLSLVGFIEEAGLVPSAEEFLRTLLATRLPGYMVPERIIALEQLPRTQLGKIDRQLLREMALPEPEVQLTGEISPLQRDLLHAWAQALRRSQVALATDFYVAGGDSLRAAHLVSHLRGRFGLDLTLRTLHLAPTPARMAQVIEGLQGGVTLTTTSALVCLQVGTGGIPVFIVAGRHATPLRIRKLADALGDEPPIYSFVAPEGDSEGGWGASFVELARKWIADLQQIQPAGPYFLIGRCSGGLIALEMARQLSAAGHAIGALGIVDSQPPLRGPGFDDRRLTVADKLRWRVKIWPRVTWRDRFRSWQQRLRPKEAAEANPWRDEYVGQYAAARAGYVAEAFPWPASFLFSETIGLYSLGLDRWLALAHGPLNYVLVPGITHEDLFVSSHLELVTRPLLRLRSEVAPLPEERHLVAGD
jgi:amino acid adenylation domain-containing protein